MICKVEKKQPKHKKSTSLSMKSNWNVGRPSPQPMSSSFGAAVIHGNVVYFSQGNNVYSYMYQDNKWETLQQCRYKDVSLAVVNDTLTTIGGYSETTHEAAHCLLTLKTKKSWEEKYPPMSRERILPASVTTLNHLVVAGGKAKRYDFNGLSSVEVFNISSNQWFEASSLPKNVSSPQMAFCDGSLYVSSINTMFTCTLNDLLKTQKHSSLSTDSKSDQDMLWTRLDNIPDSHKTSLVVVMGNVLAIGSKMCTKPE